MVFLAPLTLLCSALIAVPVIIHLLVRRRARRLDFPSLRYLRETNSFRLRPRRIQQPLLLALRIAVFALLIAGFARPLILSGVKSNRITHVILLDASLSMNARGRIEAAKEQARNVINKLKANDRAALIEFSSDVNVLAKLTSDRQTLLRALDQYQTKSHQADYAVGLDEAETLLQSESPGVAEIDLISDFQQSGLKNQKPFHSRSAAAHIVPLPVGMGIERNTFLMNEAASAGEHSIELSATEIVSAADGRSGARHVWTIDAPSGKRSNLEWHTESNDQITGSLTTIAPDDFDADDKRFFAFTRTRSQRVLLIDAVSDADVYLRAALEAATTNANKQTRNILEERGELPLDASTLASYTQVVLTLHDAPRESELNIINEYTRRGGIVWLWLARDADAAAWSAAAQTEAGRALPFEQLNRISNTRNLNFVAADTDALPLRLMSERSIGALRAVRVRSGYNIMPREDAATLLRWSDAGAPAFVSMKFGEGLVMLCATSAERAASDLGQSAALPTLASVVLRVADALREPLSQTLGEPVRLNLPPDTEVEVFDTKNRVAAARVRELAARASTIFREPGIYRIEWAKGSRFLALHAPAAESERALADAEEIKRRFTNEEDGANIPSIDLWHDAAERQSDVWRYFLAAAFVLLVAELFIARKLRRTNGEALDNLP